MSGWLREHGHALRDALSRFLRALLPGLLNLVVIGVALSLPLALYVVLKNLAVFSHQAAAEPQLTLFLALDAESSDAQAIGTRLKGHPAVGRFQYVPKDRALEELKKTSGLTGVIEELGRNPLPDAFVVTGRPDEADALEALRAEATGWPKVEHAQLDTVWARQVEAALRAGRVAVAILATLLGAALMAITFNTIRLQILDRREEIEVLKLIGATNGFIRRPFLTSAGSRVLGGLLAWGLVLVAVDLLERELGVATSLFSPAGGLRRLDGIDVGVLLAAAVGLGWLGAWFSVTFHLRRFDPT